VIDVVPQIDVVTHSEEETAALGRELARHLRPGVAMLLEGPLGAGKTALARGLAEGLGAPSTDVSSPTFTIVQEYQGRARMTHVDLYRLNPAEVDDLGLDEMLEESALVIEWPDRWHDAPPDAVRVRITIESHDDRRIAVTGIPTDAARAYSTR
jgi:tRNA threonylcarbamoyladenosine biosynthesis protein TsaE